MAEGKRVLLHDVNEGEFTHPMDFLSMAVRSLGFILSSSRYIRNPHTGSKSRVFNPQKLTFVNHSSK
jgi:hypothetical protein